MRSGKKFEGRWIRTWDWYLNAYQYQAEGGGIHHAGVDLDADLTTAAGKEGFLSYRSERRPPHLDRVWYAGFSWNRNEPLKSGGLSAQAGKLAGADYLYAGLWQGFCSGKAWAFEVESEYQRMALPSQPVDDTFQGILSANFDLDPEHGFAGRYVNTGGQHNFYVSYRQVVRKGLDAYVIIGNPNVEKTEGRLALKLIACF